MKKRFWLSTLALVFAAPCAYYVYQVNYVNYKASRTFENYYLPAGYAGYVTIRYRISGAPPIPFQPDGIGGTYTYNIPESGCLETSSPLFEEWHTTRLYRADTNGKPVLLERPQDKWRTVIHDGNPDLPDTHEDKTWVSSGSYNDSYGQFYVFDHPVGLWEQPPEPTGPHRLY